MTSKNKTRPQTFMVRDPETGSFSMISSHKGKQTVVQEPPQTRALRTSAVPTKHVLILGGGISGLTAAYDLLKLKKAFKVTIIEATNRTGGRSLTLRNNDSFTEVYKNETWKQTCKLETEANAPYKAYLNAGPGRIPSAHYHVLNLCKELNVDLEVYIMQSRSNLIRGEGDTQNSTMVNRRVANDTVGLIADDLYQFLKDKGEKPNSSKYLAMLTQVGALTSIVKDNEIIGASYKGSQRSGYRKLPDTQPGVVMPPYTKAELLKSEFWKYHFYQPEDFLWQQTSFQPVGGMDMIEKALVIKIEELGGLIIKNAPVTKVKPRMGSGWIVSYGTGKAAATIEGDYCLCNIPIPLMRDKLEARDFSAGFWQNLAKVMIDSPEFLAPTCKVGWQAERELWQKLPTNPYDPTIPIFGGISYTNHAMTQMWYPSDRFHDRLGVLTGAYNYGNDAKRWGTLKPLDRVEIARKGAEQLHGKEFAANLRNGIAIAWQNIPTQKGGWADWNKVEVGNGTDAEKARRRAGIMNIIRGGDRDFFFIGDQVSWLPGWKEGAIAVAQEVYGLISKKFPGFEMLEIEQVPDTKSLIQGHLY